jgi:hypothetical protein
MQVYSVLILMVHIVRDGFWRFSALWNVVKSVVCTHAYSTLQHTILVQLAAALLLANE